MPLRNCSLTLSQVWYIKSDNPRAQLQSFQRCDWSPKNFKHLNWRSLFLHHPRLILHYVGTESMYLQKRYTLTWPETWVHPVSRLIWIQTPFTFLVPAYPGCPGKKAVNGFSVRGNKNISAGWLDDFVYLGGTREPCSRWGLHPL